MAAKVRVSARVNGEDVDFICDPHQSLLECLRNVLNLTGTKEGCNRGNCGACSVFLNGRLVNSCLVLAAEIDDQEVTTIEGLAESGQLRILRQAFLDNDAEQSDPCTPGMLMASKALLDNNPNPTEEQIHFWLAEHLRRCNERDKIVRAVMNAAALMTREGAAPLRIIK